MSKLFINFTVISASFMTSISCVTAEDKNIQLDIQVPVLEKVSKKNDTQKKGKVRVTIEPYSYTPKMRTKYFVENKTLPGVNIVSNNDAKNYYKIIETPYFVSSPQHITFKVKIKNLMNNILRLEGSALTMKSNKNTLVVAKKGYESLQNGVILPQEEKEFEVYGIVDPGFRTVG